VFRPCCPAHRCPGRGGAIESTRVPDSAFHRGRSWIRTKWWWTSLSPPDREPVLGLQPNSLSASWLLRNRGNRETTVRRVEQVKGGQA
jgi:hypothetical protein